MRSGSCKIFFKLFVATGKEIRENNETRNYSAKYIRNLNGYAKYRELTTIEIVRRLTVWKRLNYIFIVLHWCRSYAYR